MLSALLDSDLLPDLRRAYYGSFNSAIRRLRHPMRPLAIGGLADHYVYARPGRTGLHACFEARLAWDTCTASWVPLLPMPPLVLPVWHTLNGGRPGSRTARAVRSRPG